MKKSDIIALRLRNQMLTHTNCKTPADVVQWLGAVQSQDFAASQWAIGLRMQGDANETAIDEAIANKTIVRSWPMRGTIHIMPAHSAKWMVRLLGTRPDNKLVANYRRAGLTDEAIALAGETIRQALQGGNCYTRAELYGALNEAGINTRGRNNKQKGMHLLIHWARHGLICMAPKKGKQQTFALLDEWLPDQQQLSNQEAWTQLARTYFRSHGPATIKDFSWWTGHAVAEARAAVHYIQDELQCATVDGIDYWFAKNHIPNVAEPQAFLLPAYDEYTVAYADRSVVTAQSHLKEIGYGIAPNIIINGQIAGTWRRTFTKSTVRISLTLLRTLSPSEENAMQYAIARYARFLGRQVVTQYG